MRWFKRLRGVSSLGEMQSQFVPIVEVPGWNGGKLRLRLRKISLLHLVRNGKLPNELLALIDKLVGVEKGGPEAIQDTTTIKALTALLHVIAQESLVEPTYEEILGKVGSISDETLMAIYDFCMSDLRMLDGFRGGSLPVPPDRDGGEVLGDPPKPLLSGVGDTGASVPGRSGGGNARDGKAPAKRKPAAKPT